MVIDPVCSLVFEAEAEEEGIMERPPRSPSEPLFSAATVIWSLVQGAVVFAVTAAIYVLAPMQGLTTDQARGLTFAALIFAIVALILVDRSRSSSLIAALSRPNRALAVALPIVAMLLGLTLFWSPARNLAGFGVLPTDVLWVPPLAGLVVLLLLEAAKPLWRRNLSSVRAVQAGKPQGH